MSNPIVHGLEVAGKDVLKVVEFPFVRTTQFVKVLGDAMTETPKVRQVVIDLVKAGESIVGDGVADVAARGLDLSSDLKTVADVQSFFKLFCGEFLPAVEAAYRLINADAKAA